MLCRPLRVQYTSSRLSHNANSSSVNAAATPSNIPEDQLSPARSRVMHLQAARVTAAIGEP